jgi:hypothetical protein
MIETLFAIGIFLALLFVATGGGLLHWSLILGIGAAVTAIGFTAGVIVGIGYHTTLYRALAPLNVLQPRWWWRPTSYNSRLPPSRRRSVMVWFYAGIVTVALDFVGCALILAALLIM